MIIKAIDNEILGRAEKIRLLVLDVDGVLTDGKLYFSNSGYELKVFNALDGNGIKLLQQQGIEVAIITGRSSQIVQDRANDLGIKYLLQDRVDKMTALNEIIADKKIHADAIAHMGDDYPDLLVMRHVGLALTTANAHIVVKQYSHWQSQYNGGEGAVREACDLIMIAQGSFETVLETYL